MSKAKSRNILPGSLAINIALMVFGLLLAGCSLVVASQNNTIASLLSGLGGGMFVAGFIGLLNTAILSQEIHKVASQPFEDVCLLSQVRGSGLEAIGRDRSNVLDKLLDSIEREGKQVIIVGSSLKGFIGVGYNAVGEDESVRRSLLRSMQNGCELNILMTSPAIAHHRSQQEGRLEGDIEADIIENLMYLVKVRHENQPYASNLQINLYDGTPTIFMVCTSEMMLLNPYPYYSTAYGSYAFTVRAQSDMYRVYFSSHFQRAWSDPRLTEAIKSERGAAIEQIRHYITGRNEHGRPIIPDDARQRDLLAKLQQIASPHT